METTKEEFWRQLRRGKGENFCSKWDKDRVLAVLVREDSILRKVRTQVISPSETCMTYVLEPHLLEPVTIYLRFGTSKAWSRIPSSKSKKKVEKPITKKEKKATERKEREAPKRMAKGAKFKDRSKNKKTGRQRWYPDNHPDVAGLPDSTSATKKAWSPLIYTAGFENSRKRH